MIGGGFLWPNQRADWVGLDGRAGQRLARRAPLDDGWSCERIAQALYLDDDTARDWRKAFDEGGLERLRRFEAECIDAASTIRLLQVMLSFLGDKVPRCWQLFRAPVTDNFCVINPEDFRVLA